VFAGIDVPSNDPELLEAVLEGVTVADHILLTRRRYPPLYASGVFYKPEPKERWLLVPQIFARGWDDCEGLAGWRAAEYRLAGIPARVHVVEGRIGRWHAVVLLPDGTIEDPSARLARRHR
jgi:hypothetical protein